MKQLQKYRTRCFFDVAIDDEIIGRIVFELFNDKCPITSENFKALCTGERGLGKVTGKPLHYKGVRFHRVLKNFIIQSGDFSQGNGRGGESIYGGTFKDENFDFKHEKPFLLSMANRGKDTNGSQFFITLAPTPHLDGVHVVFGHVIQGEQVVNKIAGLPVDKHDKPQANVTIANCGELIPQLKTSTSTKKAESDSKHQSSSESSSSESSDSDSSSDDGEVEEGEITNDHSQAEKTTQIVEDLPGAPKVFAINPEEIPEVPMNRFLSRGDPVKANGDRPPNRGRNERVIFTKSGRKVKGRGAVRYRTPSPDRGDRYRFRRSNTPEHWKMAQKRVKSLKDVLAENREKEEREERRRQRDENNNGGHRHREERSLNDQETSKEDNKPSDELDKTSQVVEERKQRKENENDKDNDDGKRLKETSLQIDKPKQDNKEHSSRDKADKKHAEESKSKKHDSHPSKKDEHRSKSKHQHKKRKEDDDERKSKRLDKEKKLEERKSTIEKHRHSRERTRKRSLSSSSRSSRSSSERGHKSRSRRQRSKGDDHESNHHKKGREDRHHNTHADYKQHRRERSLSH